MLIIILLIYIIYFIIYYILYRLFVYRNKIIMKFEIFDDFRVTYSKLQFLLCQAVNYCLIMKNLYCFYTPPRDVFVLFWICPTKQREKLKFSFKVHCTLKNTYKNKKFVANSRVLYYKLDRFCSRVKSSKYFSSSLSRQTVRKDLRVTFVLSKIAVAKLSQNIFFL